MSLFLTLLKHELKSLLLSPYTYIAGALFISILGFSFLIILQTFTQLPSKNTVCIEFFNSFWIPTLFVIPLLTMRSFSEEKSSGTLEVLFSAPVNSTCVVLAKFFSAYIIYLSFWFLSALFPTFAKYIFTDEFASNSIGSIISFFGGFLFIAVSSTAFISIGILISGLTKSQLISGVGTFFFILLLLSGSRIAEELSLMQYPIINAFYFNFQHASPFDFVEDFSRGIIDSRPIFFYLAISAFLLFISSIKIKSTT